MRRCRALPDMRPWDEHAMNYPQSKILSWRVGRHVPGSIGPWIQRPTPTQCFIHMWEDLRIATLKAGDVGWRSSRESTQSLNLSIMKVV